MSTQLKELRLPQLVEERRKHELQQQQLHHQLPPPCLDEEQHAQLFFTFNSASSSSDFALPSPVTPTFSRSSQQARFSSSSSSLETTDSPASPSHPIHVIKSPTKLPLPDVQEDPSEREDDDTAFIVSEYGDTEFPTWSYCLCDAGCSCDYNNDTRKGRSTHPYSRPGSDYDLGSLSDGDFNGSPRSRKRRVGSDAGIASWGTRLGSRLTSLPRWRSASVSRRANLAFSPASDPALAEQRRPSFSHAASSRSSSVSVPAMARVPESVPATPALSFYESTDSIVPTSPLDIQPAAMGKSLERDRSMATTPLLPPLMMEKAGHQTQPQSLQTSPLQSPAVVPSPIPEFPVQAPYPTPPLSTKASFTSLRRGTVSSIFSDLPSPVVMTPTILVEQQPDAWSDRLGHANFTIDPKPYVPEKADLATFQAFCSDWNLARTNYAKHLGRTGEHYGTTSKTYTLTEAKWADIEREWQQAEQALIQRVGQSGNGNPSIISHLRRTAEEMVPCGIPQIQNNDGKFPALGDSEIVGPMARDAVMVRDGHDEKRSASIWLKNLAEKVGLRK
ncbi:hypothetical protein QC764_502560 [Podospora pseudoanserina]|uniref:Only prolin and serin are matching in the corresponding protein n=1 Tax=Podospora pseudoanserina TaxID=2609844 RepID=A0ABR0I458_9PEZI|nr:hypothetical protein QC764_502560 [Podospora pseudoanserina]